MAESYKGLSFSTQHMRKIFYMNDRPSYARDTRYGQALITSIVTDQAVARVAAKIEDVYRTGANTLAAAGKEDAAKAVIAQGRSKEEGLLRSVGMGARRVVEHWGSNPDHLPTLQAMADAIDAGELSPQPEDRAERHQFAGTLALRQARA